MTLYKKREYQTLLRLIGAKFFLIQLIIISIINFSSCDKESSVGLNVQPKNDLLIVGFQDTTTLFTRSVKEDHLRTDENLITGGVAILGKYIDPMFGTANASIYTQIRLPSSITSSSGFGSIIPTCDSVVLSLIYSPGVYGEAGDRKPIKNQTINVYQLSEDLSSTIAYYSDTTVHHLNNDLANNFTFRPDLSDSVHINEYNNNIQTYSSLAPQLRIPLQKDFGQTILNNQNTGNLYDGTSFQKFLKGFYITTKNTSNLNVGDGRILQYEMANSNMTIYYHYQLGGSIYNTQYLFPMSSVNRFATFETPHAAPYTSPDLMVQLADTNRAHTYSTTYIQSLAGAKTKVTFPYLMNWVKPYKIAVNNATLVIKVDPSTIKYYTPPTAILVFGINDDGTSYLLPDLTQPPYYYDGSYNTTTNEYNINISRYIQQVLDGTLHNNGVYLLVPHVTAATSANRVEIGGGAYPGQSIPYQMKLNVTYTKLH